MKATRRSLMRRRSPRCRTWSAKQARERHPDLNVLYTTGQTVTDGMKALFVEGAKFLEKPYTVDQLSSALAAHFDIRPRSSGSDSR
jgi:DNA-binding NtrC family response regulator